MTEDNSTVAATRVCIKNLPASFDEIKLKKFLNQESKIQLTITDCKILRRKTDGASRKLAFVGFENTQQAQHAVQYFHRTYCLTSRLLVEQALVKDSSGGLLRPWSKHSKGSSKYEKIHGQKKNKTGAEQNQSNTETLDSSLRVQNNQKEVLDKRKEEFLAAMGIGKSKTKFWANDDGMLVDPEDKKKGSMTAREKDVSGEMDGESSSESSSDSGGMGGDVLKSSSAQTKAPLSVLTDLEFLRSKSSNKEELQSEDESEMQELNNQHVGSTGKDHENDTDSEGDNSINSSHDDTDTSSDSKQVEKPTNEPNQPLHDVIDTNDEISTVNNRLFIRNLAFSTTEEDLSEHLVSFGSISECHIPIDDQKRNKGYAFVTFDSADSAIHAKESLNGRDFKGRILHILPARKNAMNDQTSFNEHDPNLTYKEKQELMRRKQTTKTGWLASFVRGDAVVDTLAQRLGLRKGDILNVKDDLSSGDAAVRLALGETHVIEENRNYFNEHGIDMEALVSLGSSKNDGDAAKRSSTAILVKNLPFETEKDELAKLFGSTGGEDPNQILLPPSRTIALVEYNHSVDAKRAMKKLAYRRFKNVPLYLEWAPMAIKTKLEGKKNNSDEKNEKVEIEEDTHGDPAASFSIYVKNLNFSTTEDRLRAYFEKHVSVRAVKIPVKVEAGTRQSALHNQDGTSKKYLSMGFGFVECDSDASVRKVLNSLQGGVLDGHTLELKRSTKNVTGEKRVTKSSTEPKSTKIMCRNVPFQATRKELLQLFGAYGQLKKVRLPKKFDGGHRGFAFIEFLTCQEAQSAMNALSRTHLYGRHLVLEWATDNEDMETLREKAQRDLVEDKKNALPNKRIKFN